MENDRLKGLIDDGTPLTKAILKMGEDYATGYQSPSNDVAKGYVSEYDKGYQDGTKETVEKFVNETMRRKQTLMNPYTDNESECVSTYWIYKLAKQLGVEIKE